jgi:metallophosphoesterase superfamily enzyme
MKHILRFNQEGKFRILMVSDIQEAVEYDERTVPALRKLIAETNPDMVIWGGDNCDGRYLKTREELDNYLKIFTAPMEEKQIPWMHVYGNHD